MYGGPRPGMAPLPGLGLDGFPPEHFPPQIPPMDFPDPMRYAVHFDMLSGFLSSISVLHKALCCI